MTVLNSAIRFFLGMVTFMASERATGIVPLFLFVAFCARGVIADDASAAVDRLIAASRIYDEREMAHAIDKLVSIGNPAVGALIAAIDDVDGNVRWQSIVAIARIGSPSADAAARTLVRSLRDSDPDVRGAAAETLGILRLSHSEVVPAIESLIDDPHGKVRADAYWALWRLTENTENIPLLVDLMNHKDWMVRETAVRHLSEIGRPAIGLLVDALNNETGLNRVQAAQALGRIGQDAAAAIEPLIAAIYSQDLCLAVASERALGHLGPLAIEPLLCVVAGCDASARVHAVNALGAQGPLAKNAVPTLVSLLDSSDSRLRRAAVNSIGRIGPAAKNAVPALRKTLSASDCDMRGAACAALESIGPHASAATSELRRLAQSDPADFVRAAASQAYRTISSTSTITPPTN